MSCLTNFKQSEMSVSKVYKNDHLLIISGLNYRVIEEAGLEMDTFRYDPILVSLFFSCPPAPPPYTEQWCVDVPENIRKAMIQRMVDLGLTKPADDTKNCAAESALWDCYRVEVLKDKAYRFEREDICREIEHLRMCCNDTIYFA